VRTQRDREVRVIQAARAIVREARKDRGYREVPEAMFEELRKAVNQHDRGARDKALGRTGT